MCLRQTIIFFVVPYSDLVVTSICKKKMLYFQERTRGGSIEKLSLLKKMSQCVLRDFFYTSQTLEQIKTNVFVTEALSEVQTFDPFFLTYL